MTTTLLLSMIAALVLSFFIPILFWGRFGFRSRAFLSTVLLGAASYLFYHLVIAKTVPMYTSGMSPVSAAVISAISYAVTLTLVNYVSYRIYTLISQEKACYFAVGTGQALSESAIVVGGAFINNIFYAILMLHGTFGEHMARIGLDEESIRMLESALTSLTPSSLFLSAFERMFFSVSLISASLFLAKAVSSGKLVKGVASSFIMLFIAYLIPSMLSLCSDESLVYVTMSLCAIFSLVMVWMLGRRGDSLPLFHCAIT